MAAHKQKGLVWIIVLATILCWYLALWLTIKIRYTEGLSPENLRIHLFHFSLIFLLWTAVMFIHNLFDLRTFRRYTILVRNITVAMAVNFLIAVLYFYVQPSLILTPRRFLAIDIVISFAFILAFNLLIKQWLSRQAVEYIYLFSKDRDLDELGQEISNHAFLGMRLGGHLTPDQLSGLDPRQSTTVVLSDNLSADLGVVANFFQLRKNGVLFFNHREFYEALLRRVYLSQLNELWFLENIHYKEKRGYNFVKRCVDLLAAFIGMVIFVVTFPVVALAIKLSSPGPVFFVQDRVGQKGKIFKIYKYRTMNGGATNTWTSHQDPRITAVGKILRRTRLDELPQFINVLKGEVSLVGPRPEQVHLVEELRQAIPFYDERHIVKPGITGWAQLYTYASSVEETKLKLQYDLYYVKHRSALFDLEIIARTIYYIFTLSGK